MSRYLLIFCIYFIYYKPNTSMAQKPPVDSAAIANWQTIDNDFSVSDDGNFLLFKVSAPNQQSLIIQSINNGWKKELIGVDKASFSSDCRKVIFSRNDTLFFFSLLSNQTKYVSDIASYGQPDGNGGDWLAYRLRGKKNEVVLLNLVTDKRQNFFDVVDYKFDNKGKELLLKTVSNRNNSLEYALLWMDFRSGKATCIWQDTSLKKNYEPLNFRFDSTGSRLVFNVKSKTGKDTDNENSIWYFDNKMNKAVLLVDTRSLTWEKELSLSNTPASFSLNGQNVIFRIRSKKKQKKDTDAAKVDVWSYKDSVLQSRQLMYDRIHKEEFLVVMNVASKNIVPIQRDESPFAFYKNIHNNFLVTIKPFSIKEPWWKTHSLKSSYLVSLKTGLRKMLVPDTCYLQYYFSPTSKYLIYFDPCKGNYFSYNLATSQTLNISDGIKTSLYLDYVYDSLPHYFKLPVGIGGWLKNDDAVLIYDNYDIWLVDPSNKTPPQNITNGYGQSQNIKLRLLNDNSYSIYREQDSLLLTAFNAVNKTSGFYATTLTRREDPELLSMDSSACYVQPSQIRGLGTVRPLKAKNTAKWIVVKQAAAEAPNFYSTADFRLFSKISNLQPEEKYNWLRAELITWKSLDGSSLQGILYKPENFDPSQKYPVIFNYYEKRSYEFHQFPEVEYSGGNINISWFVSRDYLVFIPDIKYQVGKPGESAYNSIVSAAKYLSQMPWVDSSRLALSGHSFGGFETNYVVTHSNIFAAAYSGSGSSDLIAEYGSLNGADSTGTQYRFEAGQFPIRFTPWERPDLYIENSPIFKANDVTAPLLIMHNRKDQVVPWPQSVELYMALRRFSKPVWMLQYDDSEHGIANEKDAKDLTIRMTQFFDHYLKGAPPPKWMTQGRPAYLKQVDDRFELDPDGFCGDNCKVCKSKNYASWKSIPF